MKKFKKILGLTVFASPLAALISCGSPAGTNEFAGSKEIIVAQEGKQTQFWNAVKAEFEKTELYKEGYRIKTVEKDVFGAIDVITQIGATDKNAPDLIYAPNDRITDLLAKKAIAVWDDKLKEEIFNVVQASDEEKKQVSDFGYFSSRNPKYAKGFYNFAHNKEGIVVMSKKPLEEVKTELSNTATDEMVELVKEGKAFFRIQDGWYGNGVFGGVLTKDEMSKVIYKNAETNKWSSGFITTDPNHAKFKEAVNVAAELIWPVFEAAYLKSETEFQSTKWHTKGITQADLKNLLRNDQNAVQKTVFELLEAGKLDYAFVGSWDFGNAAKLGINTFFHAPKLKGQYDYKQAPGTWSWAINSRNNGSSDKRKQALGEVLKLIFKVDSYYGYFKGDTKVPLFNKVQKELQAKSDQDAATGNTNFQSILTKSKYSSADALYKAYDKLLSGVNEALSKVYGRDKSWSQDTNKTDLLNEANLYTETVDKTKDKYVYITDEVFNKLPDLKKAAALRNVIAALLGLTNLDELKGTAGDQWQVANTLSKTGSWPKEYQFNENNAHVRNIEAAIFGAKTDEGAFLAVAEEIKEEAKRTAKLEEVKRKAKEFSNTYAKTTVSDDVINKAAELYFNNFINQSDWLKWQSEYKTLFESQKASQLFPKEDGTEVNGTATAKEVEDAILESRRSSVAKKVIDVISSTTSLTQGGYGTLKLQEERLDRGNPQFGSYWGNWNDKTWGNQQFYEDLAKDKNNNDTLEKFQASLVKKLSNVFADTAKAQDSSNALDYIK
ncbi:type 2 periplasmic-binding domain-containing protein [Mesomycoplasma molare]|uniref:Lipoprotein n=1 Tax=Mesomycoplasma molare TaxID=171288 RepID=A0ABY5TU46_9BACT|nr:hypothetical protein [Mesomycoplasma molare]UWD34189.1 hypothetical protein NX772_03845 [Mesomycoplasma molare]